MCIETNMNVLKQQKKLIAFLLVVVISLSVVTFRTTPNFRYNNPTIDNAANQAAFEQRLAAARAEYQKYLDSIQADPEASKLVFQEVLKEEDVKQIVESQLNVNQKIELPKVDDKKLAIQPKASIADVQNYFKTQFQAKKDFTESTLSASWNLYKDGYDSNELEQARSKVNDYVSSLYATKVPAQVATYHKDIIALEEGYGRQLDLALKFRNDDSANIWPTFYKEWNVSNDYTKDLRTEFDKLDKQFAIGAIKEQVYADSTTTKTEKPLLVQLGLVHEADAVFGIGDFTFNIEVGNIVEEIKDAIAAAIAQFQSAMIGLLISKIEDQYRITSYLNYTDALIAGDNIPTLLDKYVPDKINQDLIKGFIPQFNCGSADIARLTKLAKQKSDEYLGFDYKSLDITKGDFYDRAERTQHLLANDDGQLDAAQDQAIAALARVSQNISNELQGTGKKTGRGANGKGIEVSVAGIQNTQQALLNGSLNLGTVIVRVSVGSLIRSLLTTFLTSFLFARAKVVFKEQDRQACLTGIQLNPIVPAQIQDPGPDKFDADYIKRCRDNPKQCINDLNTPPPPQTPPPPDPTAPGLHMDKNPPSYKVGEVPKFQILGSSKKAGTPIQWKTEKIKDANNNPIQATPGIFSYCEQTADRNCAPQAVDDNGNWPDANLFKPFYKAFACGDEGVWRKTALIDGEEFTLDYTVEANPNFKCNGALRDILRPTALLYSLS